MKRKQNTTEKKNEQKLVPLLLLTIKLRFDYLIELDENISS